MNLALWMAAMSILIGLTLMIAAIWEQARHPDRDNLAPSSPATQILEAERLQDPMQLV